MKNKKKIYLGIFLAIFIAIEIALYFVHPFAPAIVFLSFLVQAPIIFLLFKAKTNGSYEERAAKRKEVFNEDHDAEKWLKKEEAETVSIGYKYWSKSGKSLSALNRAEISKLLKQNDQVVELLSQVQAEKLSDENQQRFLALEKEMQEICIANTLENVSAKKEENSTISKGDTINVDV